MPNHITTICTVAGPNHVLASFVEKHIVKRPDEDRRFDFDTVTPRPTVLDNIESGGDDAALGMAALVGDVVWTDFTRFRWIPRALLAGPPYQHAHQVRAWLEAEKPEFLAKGRKALAAIVETGYPSWYEWSIANWGTKWNAYDYDERSRGDGRFVFKFNTAWSFPEPVFRKLATLYPTLVFAVIAFDEGGNFGCEGEFNGADDYRCEAALATPELYERVYGEKYPRDDEAETS